MRRALRRGGLAAVATGLVALSLPAAPATAMPAVRAGGGDGTLGGFAASAIATPIRVEVHEPLIPIPAEPQAELDVAYTKAVATSGPSGKGRATWLWPGDPLGEGFKTFVEQMGLPKELGSRGYPVQVNSEYPSDSETASDEPVPGLVMRTSADEQTTVAKAGFSSTGDLEDGDGDAKKGDKPSEEPPAFPPTLPGLPGADLAGAAAPDDEPGAPLGALAALVTGDAVNSVSKTTYGADTVVASAVTRIKGLSLLGGVVTADSVRVLSRTTSTLTGSKNENDVTVEGLAIGGVPFGIDDDGVVVNGESQEIPGLPDEPSEALAALGISFTLPTATKTSDGGSGSQEVRGLQVSIDFAALRSKFDSGPVDGIIASLPDDLGDLKAALGAVTKGQPHIVIVLGEALTDTSTVAPLSFDQPTTPTEDPTTPTKTPTTGGAGSASTGGSGGVSTSGSTGSSAPTDTGAISGPVETTDVAVQPVASGLPPLASVPGALLVGGLVLAGALGWWLQKMGGLVLGGAASCAHGLASGVPDLRKA